jgi:hypothetical protein
MSAINASGSPPARGTQGMVRPVSAIGVIISRRRASQSSEHLPAVGLHLSHVGGGRSADCSGWTSGS